MQLLCSLADILLLRQEHKLKEAFCEYKNRIKTTSVSKRSVGTPQMTQSKVALNQFLALIQKHDQFIEKMYKQYYLDYWVLQSS